MSEKHMSNDIREISKTYFLYMKSWSLNKMSIFGFLSYRLLRYILQLQQQSTDFPKNPQLVFLNFSFKKRENQQLHCKSSE